MFSGCLLGVLWKFILLFFLKKVLGIFNQKGREEGERGREKVKQKEKLCVNEPALVNVPLWSTVNSLCIMHRQPYLLQKWK